MIPGMNPRQMKQAMKKLGMDQVEIDDAIAVVIRTKTKDIIIRNPNVSKINMMGNWTYQVSGEEVERLIDENEEIKISSEDVKTVMEQSNCTKEIAEEALEKSNGDLAKAIISLQKE